MRVNLQPPVLFIKVVHVEQFKKDPAKFLWLVCEVAWSTYSTHWSLRCTGVDACKRPGVLYY